jgi:hypothetical protein
MGIAADLITDKTQGERHQSPRKKEQKNRHRLPQEQKEKNTEDKEKKEPPDAHHVVPPQVETRWGAPAGRFGSLFFGTHWRKGGRGKLELPEIDHGSHLNRATELLSEKNARSIATCRSLRHSTGFLHIQQQPRFPGRSNKEIAMSHAPLLLWMR